MAKPNSYISNLPPSHQTIYPSLHNYICILIIITEKEFQVYENFEIFAKFGHFWTVGLAVTIY